MPLLTHLGLLSETPLSLTLTRFGLHLLAHLRHLRIVNHYGALVKSNHFTHPPEHLLPPAPPLPVRFKTLSSLWILFPPHGCFKWAEPLFPALSRATVVFAQDEYKQACEECFENGDFSSGHQVALDSLRSWTKLTRIYIGE